MTQARLAVHSSDSRFMFGAFNTPDPAQADVNFVYRPSTVEEFGEHSRQFKGVAGDPTKATPEKGRLIHEAQVSNVCELIEIARSHPMKIKDFSIPI